MDDEIREEFEKTNAKIDNLSHKLFIDNGDECLQSRINRMSTWIAGHINQGDVKTSFWFWFIPLTLTVLIFAVDIYTRYRLK